MLGNFEYSNPTKLYFGDNVFPKFSILNPIYTYTLPQYQMVAGFYDIMSHILEQYFSGTENYYFAIRLSDKDNEEAISSKAREIAKDHYKIQK